VKRILINNVSVVMSREILSCV